MHAIVITYFVLLILLTENMQISSKRKYVMSLASFPGSRPASRRLQYGKAGEGLVHFSHVSDITDRENYANVGDM